MLLKVKIWGPMNFMFYNFVIENYKKKNSSQNFTGSPISTASLEPSLETWSKHWSNVT